MNIHVLQHVSFESPGMITNWANARQHTLSYTCLFQDTIVYPDVAAFDILIIMGGPMGVYEEAQWPWMKAEKTFIKEAVVTGKTVLGICLGSQLLAEALGAKVYPHHTKEIGFFPVTINEDVLTQHLPKQWMVFHWHGDTFDLPEGAVLLASSAACTNQAFRRGKCTGLQFHPEADTALIQQMMHHEKAELVKDVCVQTEEEITAQLHTGNANEALLFELMDNIAALNIVTAVQ
jgi:GMP synthase-like glutamine amidotransferase